MELTLLSWTYPAQDLITICLKQFTTYLKRYQMDIVTKLWLILLDNDHLSKKISYRFSKLHCLKTFIPLIGDDEQRHSL